MTERNYNGDTFHNQWQSYKENNNPKEDYEAKHKYEKQQKEVRSFSHSHLPTITKLAVKDST